MWLGYLGAVVFGVILGFISGVIFMDDSIKEYKQKYEDLYKALELTEQKVNKYFEGDKQNEEQKWW